jgi:HlyD family secretion protein
MTKKKTQATTDNVGDNLMRSIAITPPVYSYVLIGILITCIIAVTWSIFGSIPQRIKGVGMINTYEGLEKVTASSSGRISEIKIKLNDQVKIGDIIAIVDKPEIKSSIDQMKLSIKQLKQRNIITSTGNTENTVIKTQSDNLAVSRLKANIEEINKSIEFYEKRFVQEKKMFDKGLITYSQYFSTQQEITTNKINKIGLEEQLDLITLGKKERDLSNNLNEIEIKNQLVLLELEIENLIKEYKLKTELTANLDGSISQLNVKTGDIVSPEYTVALITPHQDKNNYILNLYVPFNSNAIVSKGMNVDIQIFSVDPYLHGYLEGKVKYVAQYMSDNEGLMNTLGNKNLIQFLDSKGGVYSVVVELEKKPKHF